MNTTLENMPVDLVSAPYSEAKKAELKKEAVFGEIQKMKLGEILSKEDMKEYVQALHDYRRWINTVYVDGRLVKFSSFVLKELDLAPLKTLWEEENRAEHKESPLETKKKVDFLKHQFSQTKWYPPIIVDPSNNKIIDGNHRALALKELGFKKVLAFEGIKYRSYDLLFRK